jgi:drug/metabolite transporter (DMT)-like permease
VAQLDLLRFVSLAAIWGSSYMFMRIAAPAFGPLPLVLLRLTGATVFFLPWLLRPPVRTLIRENLGGLALLGAMNSAIPFVLLAFSTVRLQAGYTAILGATVPLFAVAIDALWWRQPLSRQRLVGLALGFCGVFILAIDHLDFRAGGSGWAVLSTLTAAACYACAAHYGKRRFAGMPVMLPAAGSMMASTVLVAPLGCWLWPSATPPLADWLAVAALAVVCTACAYLLYYQLILRISATSLTGVAFVIPVFGVLWGALFLHEQVTAHIVTGMLITLAGTAFTTGLVNRSRHSPA